eukprot:COSAG01_NODE_10135_length_2240_cov_377.553947_2_plen_183_part_00
MSFGCMRAAWLRSMRRAAGAAAARAAAVAIAASRQRARRPPCTCTATASRRRRGACTCSALAAAQHTQHLCTCYTLLPRGTSTVCLRLASRTRTEHVHAQFFVYSVGSYSVPYFVHVLSMTVQYVYGCLHTCGRIHGVGIVSRPWALCSFSGRSIRPSPAAAVAECIVSSILLSALCSSSLC